MVRGVPGHFFKRKSIQFQLFFAFLAIQLVSILLVGYLTYHIASDSMLEEVKGGNEQLMDEIARNVEQYFGQMEIEADRFATHMVNGNIRLNDKSNFFDTSAVESIMEINKYLFSTFEASDRFLSIRVYSAGGQFISSAFDKETYDIYAYNTEEEREWQTAMRANAGDRLIFDVHAIDRKGVISLTASKAVINPYSGKKMGYISFDHKLESFAELFQPFERRQGSRIQVVSKEGKVLYHTDNRQIGAATDSAEAYIRSIQESDHRQVMFTRELPEQDIYIVSSVPLSLIMSNIDPIRSVMAIIVALSIVLAFALSFFLSLTVSKPIKQLSKAMQRVERGQLSTTIPVNESSLETHLLSRSFASMLNRINELVKTQYEMELHKKDAELKALMMQINPHFLYNTLEVISGIADEKEVGEISEITQSLSKMLRYNINLKSEVVQLSEEIDNCSHFFLILQSRFGDKLHIERHIDPEALSCKIMKITLQPLIENSVRYGVERKLGQAIIRLEAKKEGDAVVIRIADNGTGFDPAYLAEFEYFKNRSNAAFYEPAGERRVGLKNVYMRLRILFGDELGFTIESVPGEGSTVEIRVPA